MTKVSEPIYVGDFVLINVTPYKGWEGVVIGYESGFARGRYLVTLSTGTSATFTVDELVFISRRPAEAA